MEENYKTYTRDNSEFFTIPSNVAKDMIIDYMNNNPYVTVGDLIEDTMTQNILDGVLYYDSAEKAKEFILGNLDVAKDTMESLLDKGSHINPVSDPNYFAVAMVEYEANKLFDNIADIDTDLKLSDVKEELISNMDLDSRAREGTGTMNVSNELFDMAIEDSIQITVEAMEKMEEGSTLNQLFFTADDSFVNSGDFGHDYRVAAMAVLFDGYSENLIDEKIKEGQNIFDNIANVENEFLAYETYNVIEDILYDAGCKTGFDESYEINENSINALKEYVNEDKLPSLDEKLEAAENKAASQNSDSREVNCKNDLDR